MTGTSYVLELCYMEEIMIPLGPLLELGGEHSMDSRESINTITNL